MPVVKSQHAKRSQGSAIVLDLADLEHQAARIVADARREAERIVTQATTDATTEAARIRAAARDAGHQEGHAAGLELGRKQGHDEAVKQHTAALAQLTQRWSVLLAELQRNLPTHLADTKTDLVRLALAIAARVTRLQAAQEPQIIKNTVSEALARVGAGRTVVLEVHPAELAAVEKYLPNLLARLRTVQSVEIKPTDTITPGGCIARFGAGTIDATLETQVRRIAEELLGGAAHAGTDQVEQQGHERGREAGGDHAAL